MSAPRERSVRVGGERCRVWERGEGEPLGFLGGVRGLPRWPPFLERLSRRRRVVAPSLPGFPGAKGHERLDDLTDWIAAALDLIEQSGLEGADLVAASVAAPLAAEVAALSRASVGRLVLISPFGLFDEREPPADIWAQRPDALPALLSAEPERFAAFTAPPEGVDPVEWTITMTRAAEAGARLLWPLGDRGLRKRLHRISARTLIVLGAEDRVIPASTGKRLAAGISGFVEIRSVEGAGHTAELDRPDAVADVILDFLD